MSSHDDQLRSILATYERSLNTSDAALAASCYTPDGIFMPTTVPTAQGADIEGAYRQIFDAIRLDVTFAVDELVMTSEHSAYALTRSHGTQTVLATGHQTPESNREMFLLPRHRRRLEDRPLHVQQTRMTHTRDVSRSRPR